jgi:hypothetical protein
MPTRSRLEPVRRARVRRLDPHLLYTSAVQHVGIDIDHATRIFRGVNRRPPRLLREDFCGTAALACAWVGRSPEHRAWGVDLHAPTLAWARRRRLPRGFAPARGRHHRPQLLLLGAPDEARAA